MVKYIGPKIRIIRRLGILPGLTYKKPSNNVAKKMPGERGKKRKNITAYDRVKLKEDYRKCLSEKQKLRFNYCITDKELYSYYILIKKNTRLTDNSFLKLLESRLDSVIYRLGFAKTMLAARQLINHSHILVNNAIITTPSFLCKKGDIISIIKKSKKLIASIIDNFYIRKLDQEIFYKNMKKSKLFILGKSGYFMPSHLKIREDLLIGEFLNSPKRKDFPIIVDELKIMQYYSR